MPPNQYAVEIANDYLDRVEILDEHRSVISELYPFKDWTYLGVEMKLYYDLAETWFDIAEKLKYDDHS